MSFTPKDAAMMQRALELARRGHGTTSPNPMVGAVVVKKGRVIGEGFHKKAGEPHAEVLAIRNAQRSKLNVQRSTLYVTLEPCCTFGKTPPCTAAILAMGISRVVVAARDPNPKHDGRGLAALRRAGVQVETGLLASQAERLNEAFNKWITTGLPFVIAKAAMSLDGKIATASGESKWITSQAARQEAHKLRANVDAIMVGSRTVTLDNPALTIRLPRRSSRQPWRVVVDSAGRTPLRAQVYSDSFCARTIVLTSEHASKTWREKLSSRGVNVVVFPFKKESHLNLKDVMRQLARRDITSVLVEGGGELLGALFDARLVDKAVFFYASKILGGRHAPSAVGGSGVSKISKTLALRDVKWRQVGEDLMVSGRVSSL